ncbi:ATP-binding protein [Archangium sp.]|jgi:signal transduction histidine kinase|uniref:ATP-binding protein n=1 Tax=Archangium sp. TaxID=1872627 RepID=UPI002EDB6E2C
MKHSRSPRSSLARATLLKLGSRIAVVIALAILGSYLHILSTLRHQSRLQLAEYVSERSHGEQALFVLAEDNHVVVKKALEKRLLASRQEDPGARFDSLFVRLPDGTVRNRLEHFDGTSMPCLFVPRGVPLDDELRRRILAAHDVLAQLGPAFHTRFTDTFITLPEGAHLSYWPERSTYCQDARPTDSLLTQEFFPLTHPENNPQRRTVWSGIYLEPISRTWMTTVSTPLDREGRHVATIGHDVILEELIARTLSENLPGAYNMLVRDDGQVIAHPAMKMGQARDPYNILSAPAQPEASGPVIGSKQEEALLRDIFEQVRNRPPGTHVQELPEHGHYIATARLQGPGWNFITVLPESVVSQPAFLAARYTLALGVLVLLLEMGIMYWVLKMFTRPLLSLAEASRRVATGDFSVELDTSRQDELGQTASAFQHMAREVQRREEELRRANEGLEQRGRELKEVHQQLVLAARQAGMAEVATNVLHNVGNVLNSVYTSAQLARERMQGLRLEHLNRLADMLDANHADLARFLTQDEQGRHVRPFLRKLGENLMEERQGILSLLDDVGRYTEHIDDIVKLQQSYARLPRLREPLRLSELVEDALRINAARLGGQQVKVERQLAPLPPVLADKHKVLMILINLISNARHALDAASVEERRLTVKVDQVAPDRIRIEVSDNGIGIAPELLTRIFQYGFTTRTEGHGFGLHSCALAAQEMGGSLMAHSEGPGRGATFTLELPYEPAP